MIDLGELERLAKAATPGPWIYKQDDAFPGEDLREIRTPHSHFISSFAIEHDAAYIVAACNAVPELIAENRTLRERAQMRQELVEQYEKDIASLRQKVRELEERNERLADKNHILHNRWETILQDYRRLENNVAKEAVE